MPASSAYLTTARTASAPQDEQCRKLGLFDRARGGAAKPLHLTRVRPVHAFSATRVGAHTGRSRGVRTAYQTKGSKRYFTFCMYVRYPANCSASTCSSFLIRFTRISG